MTSSRQSPLENGLCGSADRLDDGHWNRRQLTKINHEQAESALEYKRRCVVSPKSSRVGLAQLCRFMFDCACPLDGGPWLAGRLAYAAVIVWRGVQAYRLWTSSFTPVALLEASEFAAARRPLVPHKKPASRTAGSVLVE